MRSRDCHGTPVPGALVGKPSCSCFWDSAFRAPKVMVQHDPACLSHGGCLRARIEELAEMVLDTQLLERVRSWAAELCNCSACEDEGKGEITPEDAAIARRLRSLE